VRNKGLPGKPHTKEIQNEYGEAKTKDLFSWDHHIAMV
jgi:hypothetical protein